MRNELWKLFGKKRTYIGFGAFLLAQNAMLLAFKFTRWQSEMERLLEGNGYLALEYVSALTVALIMLIPQIALLMPLYTALVGGDLVAKEVEDGTLRMILSRPISRFRLLLVKWLAGGIFSAALVVMLGVTALGFARLWFPWQGMFVFIPGQIFNVLSPADGLRFYAFSHLFMTLNACTVLGIALMFSSFNIKPAAATILALSLLFANLVMEGIPFFERYHQYLLTFHFHAWRLVFSQPMPWAQIAQSVCVLLAVNLTTFLIAAAAFQARDIKS
ncbi:MAG: ABC transporter permease subunit [Verrucomicrobia bacterium]|nr:ABC transporter permease subunit [Verrucomicrobiota bacterium]MBP8015362.1 ABC transporter permease subunit [Verrucomicrobiota bacterium]HNW07051.1 ABC transporter permease subunit [Verrucomicrobiota bacterium]HNZ75776.1 ABC transporter permease subunit [Verrucomicrobiota bacterium]HOC50554.1 ABC transporter permease subunit [Verrucomicrobiota bacterium]